MLEMLLSAWTMSEVDAVGWGFNPTQAMVVSSDNAWVASDPSYLAAMHKVGVCQAINSDVELYVASDAESYVYKYMNKEFSINPDGTERTDITERIVEQPKHGRIILDYVDETGYTHPGYRYVPDASYFDYNIYPDHEYDHFIMEAKTADITVQVYYTMSVRFDAETYTHDENAQRIDDVSRCPNGESWKISQSSFPTMTFRNLTGAAVGG